MDTKKGYSSPFYKMALDNGNSEPSTSEDFQTQTENTVFNPLLGESVMRKPSHMKANSIFTEKNLSVSGPVQFKLMLFKGQLY